MNLRFVLFALAAATPSLGAQADSSAWWRDAARKDISAARETMRTKFITALNSPGPNWDRLLNDATSAAEKDVERVHDAASYQSTLKHFVSTFDDAHVRVRFTKSRELPQEWPGFLVRYQAGHFTVVESDRAEVRVGSAITGCDGKPIDQVLEQVVPYEQVRRHLELESTRTTIGRLLFVDAVGSLRPRATRCRISGYDIAMDWRPIMADRLAKLNSAHA